MNWKSPKWDNRPFGTRSSKCTSIPQVGLITHRSFPGGWRICSSLTLRPSAARNDIPARVRSAIAPRSVFSSPRCIPTVERPTGQKTCTRRYTNLADSTSVAWVSVHFEELNRSLRSCCSIISHWRAPWKITVPLITMLRLRSVSCQLLELLPVQFRLIAPAMQPIPHRSIFQSINDGIFLRGSHRLCCGLSASSHHLHSSILRKIVYQERSARLKAAVLRRPLQRVQPH